MLPSEKSPSVALCQRRLQVSTQEDRRGTVDTKLLAPFGKGGLEVRSPEVAANELLAVIEALGPDDSGRYFDP